MKKITIFIIIVLILSLLIVGSAGAVPFQTLEKGAFSGYNYGSPNFNGEYLDIKNDADWSSFWAKHKSNTFPTPPKPVIDFSKDMVLVAIYGTCPTGGYDICIVNIVRAQNNLIIYVDKTTPDPGQIVLPVVTNPYHIVTTPISKLKLDWRELGSQEITIEPRTLNLDSKGNSVNIKIEGFTDNPNYSPLDIDTSTVKIENIECNLKYGTYNKDKYITKADRLALEDAIGAPGESIELEVSGYFYDGTPFKGTDTIKAV